MVYSDTFFPRPLYMSLTQAERFLSALWEPPAAALRVSVSAGGRFQGSAILPQSCSFCPRRTWSLGTTPAPTLLLLLQNGPSEPDIRALFPSSIIHFWWLITTFLQHTCGCFCAMLITCSAQTLRSQKGNKSTGNEFASELWQKRVHTECTVQWNDLFLTVRGLEIMNIKIR